MSALKVNNSIPSGGPPPLQESTSFDQAIAFSVDQMKVFKEAAKQNELNTYLSIVSQVPSKDLSEDEKEIIREEMQTQSSMIMMIFRFFLQSNEYQFFVRRLKNVSMTKMSLKQLRSNETILGQRQEALVSRREENTQDYLQRAQAANMNPPKLQQFHTPQKMSTKLLSSNLNSYDQDRKLLFRG